jgi:2'-5' RNA ligase
MENQKVIRTFVAVCLDEELRSRISDVQERVMKLAPNVKWVAPDNFHVTLKFLGNVSPKRLSVVQAAMDEVAGSLAAFDLAISGTGVFPTPRRPRVIWAGVEEGREQLVALADAVEKVLVKAGFEKEEKPFRSHITIGRVKESKPVEGLVEGLEEIDTSGLGVQRVASISVMESVLRPGGPEYTPLSVHKLV